MLDSSKHMRAVYCFNNSLIDARGSSSSFPPRRKSYYLAGVLLASARPWGQPHGKGTGFSEIVLSCTDWAVFISSRVTGSSSSQAGVYLVAAEGGSRWQGVDLTAHP